MECIPFDCIEDEGKYGMHLYGLPTRADVKFIPLEITDETHDLYYAEVNYLLMRHVYWVIINLLLFISYVISIRIFLTRMFGLPSDLHTIQVKESIV